jgi:hypothetical protein
MLFEPKLALATKILNPAMASDEDDSDAEERDEERQSQSPGAASRTSSPGGGDKDIKNAISLAKRNAVKANSEAVYAFPPGKMPSWGEAPSETRDILIEATLENLLVSGKVRRLLAFLVLVTDACHGLAVGRDNGGCEHSAEEDGR